MAVEDQPAESERHKEQPAVDQMEAEAVGDRRMGLCELFPNASTVLLNELGLAQISHLALLNQEHFDWVRSYCEKEHQTLNIKLIANKFCLSRQPCDLANFSCGHRQVKTIGQLIKLIQMGVMRITKLFVEVHAAPKVARLSMHALHKLLAPLCDVREVYIDVNKEEPYVEPIKALLERNAETIEAFYVRRGDENTSKLNFIRFLNITKFGINEFPLKPHYIAAHQKKQTKKKRKAAAEQAAAEQAAANNALLGNMIFDIPIL